MASSYTEHFQLNQWATEDPVLREDFNADNAKLDKAIPRIVTGTYTGDGTADRTIYLGFRPKAVLLFPEDGTTCFYFARKSRTPGLPSKFSRTRARLPILPPTEMGRYTITLH